MAYDYTRDALYRAERRPVFPFQFEIGSFQRQKTGFSPTNSWHLSNFAHLAYYDFDGVLDRLGRLGLALGGHFEGGDTAAYLARHERFAVLAFRGTEPDRLRDWLTDVDLLPATLAPGVEVHRGFLEALDEVWAEIDPHLAQLAAEGIPVWYTGHSLGAALATLAAARRPPASLYTFASPRVGGPGLGRLAEAIPTQRFVNCTDLVATLPPPHPKLFRHVGTLRFLTSRGQLLDAPSDTEIRRAQLAGHLAYRLATAWLWFGRVKLRSFVDHSIVNYSEAVRRMAVADARR